MLSKVSAKLDRRCRDFIAKSPFVIVASAGTNGNLDVSPKGDPAGFVRVLDQATLAIPDEPGNRRIETFRNILQHPSIGLIFLVPGSSETLRIGGTALIVRDQAVRALWQSRGRLPALAMIVRVDRVYFHCGKCVMRSKLWGSLPGVRPEQPPRRHERSPA
jgi:PPOX class probable FMN-dependent enzyme